MEMISKKSNFLAKMIFTVPLFLFGIWLVQLIYFPHLDLSAKAKAKKAAPEETVFRKILTRSNDDGRGHFHMLDEYITQPEPFKPLCLTCHGAYPHSKEKRIRSILNFHTGFMACAVCHVRKDPAHKDYFFVWVDRNTGIASATVEGEFGKYPAKIYPMIITSDNEKKIFRPVSEKAAQEYLKLKDIYTPDQNAQAKIMLHEKISKKPVFCTECHKKDGYLNFADLGFPKSRINHLISTEVAGMIDKYETFYLPSVIDFGAGNKK